MSISKAPSRPILTPRDLFRIQMADDPQISPDGRHVAWVHTWMDAAANDYRSVICVSHIAAGTTCRITHELGLATHPRWSPDGTRLAYLTNRITETDPASSPQLCIIPSAGGIPNAVTRLKHGVAEPIWSPDGSHIACTTLLDPAIGPRAVDAPGDEADPYVRYNRDVLIARRRRWKMDGYGYPGELRRTVLLVGNLAAAHPTVTAVAVGNHDLYTPVWSPDGGRLAAVGNLDADADSVRRQYVYVIEIGAGQNRPHKLAGLEDIRHSQVAWSPDGSQIAITGHDDPNLGHYGNQQLWTIDVKTAAKRCVTKHLDWTLGHAAYTDVGAYGGDDGLHWMPDGRHILALVSRAGTVHATSFDAVSGEARAVTAGTMTIAAFTVDQSGQRMAVLQREPHNPGDIFCYDLTGNLPAKPRQITAVNVDWLGDYELSSPEKFYIPSDDQPVDAWILPPIRREPGGKVPAILYTGGGPAGMRADNFMFEYQLLAAQGYALIFCNAHGCQGYGQDFCTSILAAWGSRDYADNIGAVEKACADYEYIDPSRLGIAGGSYGGYLVNWAIGHTNRFRAAVSDRSVFNRHSSFGTSDIGHLREFEFGGGPPWETGTYYRSQSPLSYIGAAKTPTLVIHSAQDLRCAIEQGEQLYLALKRLGVPTEFVRFANESHGLSRGGKPWHRVFRLQCYLDWFSRWLSSKPSNGECYDHK